MKRTLLAASVALALTACRQDPGGRCVSDAECKTGLHCSNGVCLSDLRQAPVGQSCYVDKDCVAWADCVQNRCLLAPGACDTGADCQPWQACNAGHGCEMAPGGCANEADCASWQNCDTSSWRCEVAPGFCADEGGCASWQDCGTDHRCATAPGSCVGDPDCETWQVCDAGAHACVVADGRCVGNADCETWQYCDVPVHQCVDVGATCAGDGECQAWQYCDSGHCLNRAGRCAVDPQCDASWQLCDASHTCVAAPDHCTSSRDCAAWESCSLAHVCGPAVPCTSAADCVAGDVCSTVCTAPEVLDAGAMYLFGNLRYAGCGAALAPVSAPTRSRVAFDCYGQNDAAYVAPNGDFVYRQIFDATAGGDQTIRRFNPDAWDWDALSQSWRYPSDPLANDLVIATPPCTGGTGFYAMQAGTGRLMYRCSGDIEPDWYRDDGSFAVRTYQVVAWNANDLMLGSGGSVPLLFDAAGAQIPITGGPASSFDVDLVAARAHADGFRFILLNSVTGVTDRWVVNATGEATREGSYPAPPAELTNVFLAKIDAAGAAYGIAEKPVPIGNGYADVVVRCQLPPDECSIVYDESNEIAYDYEVTPPRTYVVIEVGSVLVTGP